MAKSEQTLSADAVHVMVTHHAKVKHAPIRSFRLSTGPTLDCSREVCEASVLFLFHTATHRCKYCLLSEVCWLLVLRTGEADCHLLVDRNHGIKTNLERFRACSKISIQSIQSISAIPAAHESSPAWTISAICSIGIFFA